MSDAAAAAVAASLTCNTAPKIASWRTPSNPAFQLLIDLQCCLYKSGPCVQVIPAGGQPVAASVAQIRRRQTAAMSTRRSCAVQLLLALVAAVAFFTHAVNAGDEVRELCSRGVTAGARQMPCGLTLSCTQEEQNADCLRTWGATLRMISADAEDVGQERHAQAGG
jgi:hypothetical protein